MRMAGNRLKQKRRDRLFSIWFIADLADIGAVGKASLLPVTLVSGVAGQFDAVEPASPFVTSLSSATTMKGYPISGGSGMPFAL